MNIFSMDKSSNEDGHINVIAEIVAKPGHSEEVREILMGLVGPARDEDGCQEYHLLVNKKDSCSFYTYESWSNEEKLQKHLEGAKPLLEKVKPLLAGDMTLTVLQHLL
jgi:quinol monooxygenase YgiN